MLSRLTAANMSKTESVPHQSAKNPANVAANEPSPKERKNEIPYEKPSHPDGD